MVSTQKITSRDNAGLKQARKTRDGKDKTAIFVEGIRLCEEALRSEVAVRECYVSIRSLKNDRVKILAAAVGAQNVKIFEVSEDIFRLIADTENPQGIVLICDRPPADRKNFGKKFQLDTEKIPVVVYLDGANNPSNLGAIVRTTEAAGAAGVIVSKNSADAFSPKSLRSSMGSAFRLQMWLGATFDEAVLWARERDLIVTAADIEGTTDHTFVDWKMPRLLVFGSEAHGLKEPDKNKIDELIKIRMDENVESLNLAVSAGIILFEAVRQMRS